MNGHHNTHKNQQADYTRRNPSFAHCTLGPLYGWLLPESTLFIFHLFTSDSLCSIVLLHMTQVLYNVYIYTSYLIHIRTATILVETHKIGRGEKKICLFASHCGFNIHQPSCCPLDYNIQHVPSVLYTTQNTHLWTTLNLIFSAAPAPEILKACFLIHTARTYTSHSLPLFVFRMWNVLGFYVHMHSVLVPYVRVRVCATVWICVCSMIILWNIIKWRTRMDILCILNSLWLATI